ncbi:MAG: mechanosensitive ion channel [Bacteroidales bacterium]|nr:mechanosensitive ion channel [Bacteroidales bacterium]
MKEYLIDLLKPLEISYHTKDYIVLITMLIALLAIVLIADLVVNKIIIKIASKVAKKSKNSWDDILLEKRFFHRLTHIIPAILFYHLAPEILDGYSKIASLVSMFTELYFTLLFVLIISALLNAINEIYISLEKARHKSIKGYIQVAKIILYFIAAILIFSILTGKNALTIIAGLGALGAVLLLVFQDAIKGLVSGVQLSANDMVRIGDWISMPKYGADGNVIEISLTTIKVQNWDKTISMIPSYALVSESFSNWRGMEESGGRRIKRSINIDLNSIHFLNEEEKTELSKIILIQPYLKQKQLELAEYHQKMNMIEQISINGRRLTNIGTYRKYLEEYLKNHQAINHEMTFMVRQLQSTETGLPLEIYCFSKVKEWIEYEGIQADIFDHVFASLKTFNLSVFQNPTGNDFKALKI